MKKWSPHELREALHRKNWKLEDFRGWLYNPLVVLRETRHFYVLSRVIPGRGVYHVGRLSRRKAAQILKEVMK